MPRARQPSATADDDRRRNRRASSAEQVATMRAVLIQFRLTFRAVYRHYERVRRTSSVSGAQLWLLAEAAEAGGATVGELADRMSIHQSTASNLLKSLEAARLVERHQDDVDRRVVRVYPIAAGKRMLRHAPRPLRGVLQQALCDLPLASLRRLHAEMTRLLHVMQVSELNGRKMLLSDVPEATRPAPVRRQSRSRRASTQRR